MAQADIAALRERYDAIVIGSGIGGLSAAALLARVFGKRVLVLEKHWTLGGQTHEFSRPGGWHWDVGLHYVGEMTPGTAARRLMDFVTGHAVEWRPMPEGYDHFVYPDFTFIARADPRQYRDELCSLFPGEASAVDRYFRDVRRAVRWLRGRVATSGMLPEPIAWPVRAWLALASGLALQTTGQWLKNNIREPRLRAVLTSQWGDYGLPPSRSAFAIHSLIVGHYLWGAHYPAGGAQTISQGAKVLIEEHGGRCLVGAEATRIFTDRQRARGVRVCMHKSQFEVESPVVISNVGAHLTFRSLLDDPMYPELEQRLDGLSAVSLYLGLKNSPAKLGVDGANHWIYESYDHDALADTRVDDPVRHVYLSFPSMKGAFEPHTAEVLTFMRHDSFRAWRDTRWKKRGPQYDDLKRKLTERMLDVVERRLPGLRSLIEYQELSTPLTMETFTSRANGLMYGVPATPERFRLRCLQARTPIEGLYLSGSDVASLGIVGALFGGLCAAAAATGALGTPRIFAAISRSAAPAKVNSSKNLLGSKRNAE